jgi:hypothetical protein
MEDKVKLMKKASVLPYFLLVLSCWKLVVKSYVNSVGREQKLCNFHRLDEAIEN